MKSLIIALIAIVFGLTPVVAGGSEDCVKCERPTVDKRTPGKHTLKKAYRVKICNPGWKYLSEGPIKGTGRVAKWWKVDYMIFHTDAELYGFGHKFRDATTKAERKALIKQHFSFHRTDTIETECKTFSVAPNRVLVTEVCDEHKTCIMMTPRITHSGEYQLGSLVCKPISELLTH